MPVQHDYQYKSFSNSIPDHEFLSDLKWVYSFNRYIRYTDFYIRIRGLLITRGFISGNGREISNFGSYSEGLKLSAIIQVWGRWGRNSESTFDISNNLTSLCCWISLYDKVLISWFPRTTVSMNGCLKSDSSPLLLFGKGNYCINNSVVPETVCYSDCLRI